jgi:hypothetical protein
MDKSETGWGFEFRVLSALVRGVIRRQIDVVRYGCATVAFVERYRFVLNRLPRENGCQPGRGGHYWDERPFAAGPPF